jgi:hypothetical protein
MQLEKWRNGEMYHANGEMEQTLKEKEPVNS